jgi:hypothetical protein
MRPPHPPIPIPPLPLPLPLPRGQSLKQSLKRPPRTCPAVPVIVRRVASSAAADADDEAANDANFETAGQDHIVLRWRDLHLAPTPLFYAMLACAMPLLMLGVAMASPVSASLGGLLLSGALGCLWEGVQTLRGLELRCGSPLPCFTGDKVMVDLQLVNPTARSRWDIAVTLGLKAKPAGNGWVDLAPRCGQQVLMPLVAEGRGRRGLPPIRLETQHPFGLVVVSAFWAPRADLLVRERPALPRV